MNLVCRTCSQTKTKFVNLFNYYHNNTLVSEMLNECTSLEFQEGDGLPLHICNECLESLTSAWHFRKMTIKMDVKLRKLVSERKLANIAHHNDDVITVVKDDIIIKDNACDSVILKKENMFITNVPYIKANEENAVSFPKNCKSSCNPDIDVDIETSDSKQLQNVQESNIMDHAYAKNDQNTINSTINDQKITKDSLEHRTENLVNLFNIPACENSIVEELVPIQTELSINDKNHQEKSTSSKNQISLTTNIAQPVGISKSLTVSHGINGKRKHSNSFFLIQAIKEDIQQDTSEEQDVPSKDGPEGRDKSNSKSNKLVILGEYRKLTQEEKEKTSIRCKICNKILKYRYYYKTHIRYHKGDLPHKCKTCGKSFARQSILKSHAIKHSDARPFTCEACGKSFKTANNLQTHKSTHIDDRPYKCNMCHLDFKSENILKIHVRRHENQRDHVCDACGKAFVTGSDLRTHLKIHTGLKDYLCTECGKAFSSSGRLSNHFRCNHTNERPYACSHCDKRFKDKGVLKKHSLIHTGERPHLCMLCGKTFRQNGALHTHMRTHTGEAPYTCKLCSSQFKYGHHLTKHMKTHT